MIRDLCVHLDGSSGDKDRLEAARRIAVIFDAHLSGVFVNRLPDMPATDFYGYSAADFDEMQSQARAKGDKIAAALEGPLSDLDVRHELRRFDVVSSRWQQTILAEARLYDLFVSTLPQEDDHEAMALVESVLFGAGHSVLLVPPKCISTLDFSTIVLGWRNTREAARAVDEALPFLKRAENVSVCMIGDDELGRIERVTQGNDIARHLDRHGVAVELNPLPEGKGVGATLLEEADLLNAGLIVMGGYGHTRLREWVLGGATREIMKKSEISVLMAH
ncbi:universal stress protein [Martelella soudanensis]|uniref:universal stress protein n=1 Tax=unclassified Martelella TaxID=2629616 RepID=UPI0015DEF98F|nr:MULTISPECIES: universal stress protein [unclassified Martelella]